MTHVMGFVFDLDGVVRIWRDAGSRLAETAHQLPTGTIGRLAYTDQFDLAHHGLLTHEEWVAGVRDRLVVEHGPAAAAAVDLWMADRGDVDHAVVDLVRRIRAAGRPVAALTNNTTVLGHDLIHHDLVNVFDAVINSAEIGATKPSPIAFRIAAAHLGRPLSAIAFVDDDPLNVHAASALGMPAHHYTTPEILAAWLAELGINPDEDPLSVQPEQLSQRQPVPLIDRVLAPLGTPVPPLDDGAESDRHSTIRVRYVTTPLPPDTLARFLATDPHVAATAAADTSVGVLLVDASATEVRLLSTEADAHLAVGDPTARTLIGAEHLREWTPHTRNHAQHSIGSTAARCAWSLTQLAAGHHHDDPIAAAAALDRARTAAVAVAAMLARHQPIPVIGHLVSRYLGPGTKTRIAASWPTHPTSWNGVADATAAIVELIQRARYTARHILGVDLCWPWEQLAATLRPILGDRADFTPRVSDDDALYGTELAEMYDQHRPVAPEMAAGLRDLARRWLQGSVVVELGAGTGRITTHLAGHARTYTAVELSPAMIQHLIARHAPNVTAVQCDAHHLDLDDDSVDVVVEHEMLPFADDPTRVLEEIERILRPGGLLVRILVHPVDGDPAAMVEMIYGNTAFAGGPGPLMVGKGTDPRLTALLGDRGWTTHEHTLATWVRERTVAEMLAPLADQAWPYLHQVTPDRHAAGMHAARRAAIELAGSGHVLRCTQRLYVLLTALGDPS